MPFTTDLLVRDLAGLLDHVRWTSAAVAGCSHATPVAMSRQIPESFTGSP